MGEFLEISTPSHGNQLCSGIGRLLDSEDDVGCDFEFSWADSTPIKAHFFVLQIFCQVLQNSNCRRICFESSEIQREDMRRLLEFVYLGKTRIELDRLDAIKRAARKLRLKTFLDLVEEIKVEEVEVEVTIENETDTENEEEVCESLAEDDDHIEEDEDEVEEDEDSSSEDRDYTECSEEEEKEQNSNVGKHDLINGDVRKHLASKKYNLRSYRGGNRNAHLPTKHQMNSNGKYVLEKIMKCDQCEYACATEVLLKIHIKNAHCETNKDKLKRRPRSVHSKEGDHACETCGKYFKTANDLRKHKMVHAKKEDCKICGKKLALETIRKHRKWHEIGGIKKVKCTICGKKMRLDSIQRHRMLHEIGGDKKFKCTICAYCCRDRFNLKKHLKNVHHMSEGKIARLVNSETTLLSDQDPPQSKEDLDKI